MGVSHNWIQLKTLLMYFNNIPTTDLQYLVRRGESMVDVLLERSDNRRGLGGGRGGGLGDGSGYTFLHLSLFLFRALPIMD